MIQTSNAFAALIDTAPEVLHLILPDGTEIPQAAIQKAYWVGGTNAGDDITLGSTVALQLQAELKRWELGGLDLTDTRLTATLTIPGADDVIPVAVLQVDKPTSDDDVVTIVACDAMIYAFGAEYALNDTVQGFDWETGVDAETLLQAICDTCGVTLATTGLTSVILTNYTPFGHTYREVIAFLSCLWGRFARINGKGELVLGWYATAERPVLPTRYYQGELKKADYAYSIGYIKCYNETLEETLTAGDTSTAQGIYIKCPWMSLERLQAIFQEIGGFTYRPVSELRFLGDPRLEPGDVLQVTDRDGTTYTVPVMTLRQEYDGGLISQLTAVGKSVSASKDDYEGPVTREIKKAVQGIKTSLVRMEDRIVARVEDAEGNLSLIEQLIGSIKLSVSGTLTDGTNSYAEISLHVGDHVSKGYVMVNGNVTVDGSLSADALYAAMGDIADLTVDKLSTSRRIVKYMAEDKTDDNYIRIQDQYIEFVSDVYAPDAVGSYWDANGEEIITRGYTQATNPNGGLLYWEYDPDSCSIGADGYPYTGGHRVFTTTERTAWPVFVYTYADQELVKRRIGFEKQGGFYVPVDIFGAGDEDGRQRGKLLKDTEGLTLSYETQSGKTLGVRMRDDGYTDVFGLRKTSGMNFSEWDEGRFYERVDGDTTRYEYGVMFNTEGDPVLITDADGHECTVEW